jgi:hypothetical protein
MNDKASAQIGSGRELIAVFDRQFARLNLLSCELVLKTPLKIFYRGARQAATGFAGYSIGENILRGAAAVEQTFGGITANLWDDPFEWTLPENLSTTARVVEYLEEVEATRALAFASFARDSDLWKEVLVPTGHTQSLIDLLVETLVKAAGYHGRANAALLFISAAAPSDIET